LYHNCETYADITSGYAQFRDRSYPQ
jgi:hypothetical protein